MKKENETLRKLVDIEQEKKFLKTRDPELVGVMKSIDKEMKDFEDEHKKSANEAPITDSGIIRGEKFVLYYGKV